MYKNFVFLLLVPALIALTPPKLARLGVENYFNNQKINTKNITLLDNINQKPMGVFVTIIDTDNKSRGCWGKLYPQSNLKDSIVNAAIDAATKDYRTRPLKKSELKSVRFQVSLVEKIIPVDSTRSINPIRDGLLVRSGAKTGVILGGEATDAYYQMVMAKLKANIQPKQKCELFKLVTKTYKE